MAMVPEPPGTIPGLPGRGELLAEQHLTLTGASFPGWFRGPGRPAGRPRGPRLFAKSTVLIAMMSGD